MIKTVKYILISRKGGEGREEGDVGGPRDILSRGPRVPSYATGFFKELTEEASTTLAGNLFYVLIIL